MNFLILSIAFILVGITLEVFWTSIGNYLRTKDLRLTGHTYLWMFIVYGIVPLIYIFGLKHFSDYSIFLRAIFYMLAFYTLEYCSGWIIKKFIGKSPWDYSQSKIKILGHKWRSNLHGLIRLEHAPVWYIYGIIFEYYFLFLTR